MTKSLEQIQQENRKFILEAIHGCSYKEALQEELGFGLKNLEEYESAKHRILSIIGKPITLSKVLLAFKNKKVTTLYKDRIIFNIEGSQFCGLQLEEEYYKSDYSLYGAGDYSLYGAGNWNLELETLEEQSEETQRAINELLTGE